MNSLGEQLKGMDMEQIIWFVKTEMYQEDRSLGATGYRRADRRFWMAYKEVTDTSAENACVFGVMDDFGNMVETDGRAYYKNARIGAIFGN